MNDRELASILAALRDWQTLTGPRRRAGDMIATDEGTLDPLTDTEIDALCEALNQPRKEHTMTELNFTDKTPVLADSDMRNESFRRAFDAIARAVVPFFDIPHAYYGDLLWDANTAVTLREGDTVFLMARSMGTSILFPRNQSYDSVATCYMEARRLADDSVLKNFPTAVFSIKREGAQRFIVTHLVTRNAGDAA